MFPRETITGTVERITFFSAETGYSVLKIKPEGKYPKAVAKDGTLAVTGTLPELGVGERVQFTGSWVEDPRYGTQFRADRAEPIAPNSREGIIAFLSSGIVKGIGPKTAQKIVDHFGDRTIDILDREPDRLKDIPTIKPEIARDLIHAWKTNMGARNALIFLQGYGISAKMAGRIYGHYGDRTVKQVTENPYTLADDVFGIGFVRADEISRSMGMALDAPERIRAGLSYALSQLSREGHTYAPRREVIAKTSELLKVDNTARIEAALSTQLFTGDLIVQPSLTGDISQDSIYLPEYHQAEQDAAEKLRALANTDSPIQDAVKKTRWEKFLADLARENNIELTPQQQDAVKHALTHKLSVLTGGPGTGKTTTLRMLIDALESLEFEYALACPTGRAAKRMGEATGKPTSTLHRLLGYSPSEGGFDHDEENPLDADILIVDESSMLDLMLFRDLLKALRPETHLMLVGDVDQLPSVGAGNVLQDVIASGIAWVTRLDTIFRQREDSQIVASAHAINHGEAPRLDNTSSDFFFFVEEDPNLAAELVVDIVRSRLPAKFGVDPLNDVQVIAPMYRGPVGVNGLNEMLQNALNPHGRSAEKKIGSRLFRVGDKVMQTKNNYDKDVFNGDIGRITGIDFDDQTFEIVMDETYQYYEFQEAEELIHAYCISTHRSQGSEYPVVVMPVLSQHYMMLQRNLLYTAITRAKKLVVLVGSRKAVHMAVSNNRVADRYSNLLPRLRGAF
jgi:exodeoxyribonuclease V alpha subunit